MVTNLFLDFRRSIVDTIRRHQEVHRIERDSREAVMDVNIVYECIGYGTGRAVTSL